MHCLQQVDEVPSLSMPNKWYAVRKGRKVGVFTSWSACEKQVKGYPGASFSSFSTLKAAQLFVVADDDDNEPYWSPVTSQSSVMARLRRSRVVSKPIPIQWPTVNAVNQLSPSRYEQPELLRPETPGPSQAMSIPADTGHKEDVDDENDIILSSSSSDDETIFPAQHPWEEQRSESPSDKPLTHDNKRKSKEDFPHLATLHNALEGQMRGGAETTIMDACQIGEGEEGISTPTHSRFVTQQVTLDQEFGFAAPFVFTFDGPEFNGHPGYPQLDTNLFQLD